MSFTGFPGSDYLATLREESRFSQEGPSPAALPAAASSSFIATANGAPHQLQHQRPARPVVANGHQTASQRSQPQDHASVSASAAPNGDSADLGASDAQPPADSQLFDRIVEERVSALPPVTRGPSKPSNYRPPAAADSMMSGDEVRQPAASRLVSGGSGAMAGREISSNTLASERRLSNGSMYSMRDSQAVFNRDALLGPKRPRPHKIWRKKYIKVLVVGDSGLGKTTLIKSLMSTPGDRLHVHDGTFTPTEQFKRDPSSLCSTISWRDEEDRVIWVYKIQDTPGYGDDLNVQNNIDMMLNYIKRQNDTWLEMEQSRDRKEDLAEVEDTRVDVCIFCLPPHRMRPVDLKYMYELGMHVPIVPVVTKADTMTIREAATYRNEVASKISNPMLPGIRDKINVFKFERDTLERAGVLDHGVPTPPFLVIASNEINEDMNQAEPPTFWPERRYPWGTAEAFNREHSDLLSLRALLLKEALEEINKTKRQRYEAWRRAELNKPKMGRRLRGVLMWTVVPAIICLQVGKKGIKVDDVKARARLELNRARNFLSTARGRARAVAAEAEEAVAPPPPPPPAPPARKKFGFF